MAGSAQTGLSPPAGSIHHTRFKVFFCVLSKYLVLVGKQWIWNAEQ